MERQNQNGKIQVNQITVNMIFSVIAFVLNLCISFFITPYITAQFGSEAYGFVKLANDFTNYASLISIALNSMASRFLMLERVQGNTRQAQKYYSSIFLANTALSALLMIPAVICVVYLEKFLEIPALLQTEVKLTFAITFASFLLNLVFSTHGNCYYLTNKLNIGSVREAVGNILRAASILLLFVMATPRISYVALGGAVAAVFVVVFNFVYNRKLIPEFRFRFADFDWEKLWSVLSAGIWNSITKLSQIFSSGLDLMVTNMLVGATEMGLLAVAKTVPNMITTFNATVGNVFSPNMMELYARKDMAALQKTAKAAMKFMCLFVTIPNAILITMGQEFFTLWVPEQPARILCILSVLTVINSCVTGPLTPLYQLFTITNKVKQSSIILIIYGFSSILVTFVCLKLTSLGVYAVAGVSLIGSLIVALCYHLPFSAIYIGLPWHTFFPEIGISVITLVLQCVIGWGVHLTMDLQQSWAYWFGGAIIAAILGLGVSALLVLNKEEKHTLYGKVLSVVKRGK